MTNYPSNAIRGIAGRLGYISAPQFETNEISGVNHQSVRLTHHGGRTQQERMILLWLCYIYSASQGIFEIETLETL